MPKALLDTKMSAMFLLEGLLMVRFLSEKIADFFIGETEEYRQERDVYVYGCEVLCSILLNIIVICAVGVVFQNLICCVVFFVSFAVVRHFSGGYHANTYLKCNLILLINSVAVMGIIALPIMYQPSSYIGGGVMMLFTVVVIYLLAPMGDVNKEVPEERREELKRKSVIVVLMFELSYCCLWLIEKPISISILMGALSAAASLITKYIIIRREKKHEKES